MSSSNELTITKIVPEDLDKVYELANRSKLSYWTKGDYLDELNRSDSIFLGLRSGSSFAGFLVGRFVPGQKSELDAELYNIAIDPPYKRQGGALLLMDRFIAMCEELQVGNIWLDVRSENTPAILLYKKVGFNVVSKRKAYYSNPKDDALIMTKPI